MTKYRIETFDNNMTKSMTKAYKIETKSEGHKIQVWVPDQPFSEFPSIFFLPMQPQFSQTAIFQALLLQLVLQRSKGSRHKSF